MAQGEIIITQRAINASAKLLSALEDMRKAIRDYGLYGYNANNFDVQAIIDSGVYLRSLDSETPTMQTLVDAVVAFNQVDALLKQNSNAIEADLALLLEGISR